MLNEPWQFRTLGGSFFIMIFWLGFPIFALIYYLRPRRAALKFFKMGLLTKAALQKTDKSVLSTTEKPKQLYTFSYTTFSDETHTAKITARPNKWRQDNKDEALVLYLLRQPEQSLLVDSIESAPKIAENGLLLPQFSHNTLAAIFGAFLACLAVLLLWAII
jgi:hypothetical protein